MPVAWPDQQYLTYVNRQEVKNMRYLHRPDVPFSGKIFVPAIPLNLRKQSPLRSGSKFSWKWHAESGV